MTVIDRLVVKTLGSKFFLYLQSQAIPLQTWTGPESCRRLRLLDFKTIGT
jgi:hypothetical protein